MNVGQAYSNCERLARTTAANFYPAFLVLPRAQRRAMFALYAFNRLTDDISDGPDNPEIKAIQLQAWNLMLNQVLDGQNEHPVLSALRDATARFGIPRHHYHEVIEGCRMDLTPRTYQTFAELAQYCRLVASSVGQACIHIWGFHGEHARQLADSAGIALQLTNILRDISEDRQRGRVYIPTEDLQRFGCGVNGDGMENNSAAFQSLMRFQVERAREYYVQAMKLSDCLDCCGRAVFGVIVNTYRRLLDRIESAAFDVFSHRVSVPRHEKFGLMVRAFPVRWGWARG